MKDSGIDWIGKIPNEWEINKIDSLYTLRNTKVSDKNYPPLSVTMKGIVPQLATAAKSDDGDNRKLVKKGDFVINSRSDRRGSSGISNYEGSVSLINTILTPRGRMNPDYYNWLFHTVQFEDEFYKWGHGIVDDLWTTRWQDMKNISVLVPPEEAQEKIANFLDKKCAQIDSIIEESKKSIEEYKSWKQSVIFEAVTGKNLSCKKKDSGIEWLGEIPENFIITRIKHIATLAGRIGWQGLTSQEYSDEGCYLITGINFSNGEINWESCVRVPYSRWEEASQIQIENGDLLITKDGTVGKVAIVNNMPDKTSLNSGVLLIRQNKKVCSTRFLFWILQSNVFWKWFNYINAGNSTIIHLYQHDFSNFSFPNPSIEIQNEISNYLDAKCAQIDSLISEKQSLIKDLAEYKKSLIFEAVTGKRRV